MPGQAAGQEGVVPAPVKFPASPGVSIAGSARQGRVNFCRVCPDPGSRAENVYVQRISGCDEISEMRAMAGSIARKKPATASGGFSGNQY